MRHLRNIKGRCIAAARMPLATALWIGATVVVAAATAAADPAPPVVEFLGERFYITRGAMEGMEGIGFNPVDRWILSAEETDLCGINTDNMLFGNAGVEWDHVNGEYWLIDNNRTVYRYLAGAVKDTLFTIPEVFSVPGVGPDTLEAPRGLALDITHVYVVDAGPDPGKLFSNAWFKFTRDGTPVSSSKATDLVANLDLAPDALIDGIGWVPPAAPFAQGLFLVALEHSGIQVIDADGFFVDKILWEDEGLALSTVPFAFVGITVDPLTGDLYLVDNDGSKMQVWVRLPDSDPQTLLYGTGAGNIVVHLPDTTCARPLYLPTQPGLLFGLTYRDVDGLLWTCDYGTGDVFTIDPLRGQPVLVGNPGIINAWGMAYDDELDLIYLYAQAMDKIHQLNPATLATVPLPGNTGFSLEEIAFSSDDNFIYAVSGGQLIRIDRTSGIGTAVGPVVGPAGIRGLAYDRVAQWLVGIDNNQDRIYRIDPSDGTTVVLYDAQRDLHSWEGLATIPVSSAPTAIGGRVPAPPTLRLRAYPNPTASHTQIILDVKDAALLDMNIYDVRGRFVRRLGPGRVPAGATSIEWDGRNGAGKPVPSGTYFIRAATPRAVGVTKVLVVR